MDNNVTNPFHTIDSFANPQTVLPDNAGQRLLEFSQSLDDFFKKGSQAFSAIQKMNGEDNKIKAVKDHLQGKYEIPDDLFNKGFGYHEAWQMLEGKSKALELEATTSKMLDELKPEAFDLNLNDEKTLVKATELFDEQFKNLYTGVDQYALLGAEDHVSKNKSEFVRGYHKKFRGFKRSKSLDDVGKAFNALMSTEASDFPMGLSDEIRNVYAAGEGVGLTKDEISDRFLSTVGVTLADEGRLEDLQWFTSEFMVNPEDGVKLRDTKHSKTINTLLKKAEIQANKVSDAMRFETKERLKKLAGTVQSADDYEGLYDSVLSTINDKLISPEGGSSIMTRAADILDDGVIAFQKSTYLKTFEKHLYNTIPQTFLQELPEGTKITKKELENIIVKEMESLTRAGKMEDLFHLSKRQGLAYSPLKDTLRMSSLASSYSEAFEANFSIYKMMKEAKVADIYMDEKTLAFYKTYDDFRGLIMGDGSAYSAEESFKAASLISSIPEGTALDFETRNYLLEKTKGIHLNGVDTRRAYKYALYFSQNFTPKEAAEKAMDMFEEHSMKIGALNQPLLTLFRVIKISCLVFLKRNYHTLGNSQFIFGRNL